jgi:hypothetical protein
MRYDFSYLQAVQARARRERAETVYRLLIAPLIALFSRPKHHHAPRPHLARQG